MNEKYKTLIKDTGIFALGSFGSKLLLFLLVPFYTNVLSTTEYGTVELVFTITNFVVPFVSLNINSAVVRYGMAKDEKKENAFLIGCVVWIVGNLLLLSFVPFIRFYDTIAEYKWYLYFSIISNSGTLIFLGYLKVKNKNKFYALISVMQTAIIAVSNIVLLVFLKKGIEGYLFSSVFAHIIVILLAFFFGKYYDDLKSAKFDKQLSIRMIKYSSPLILNNISWWFINSFNKILIEVFLGVSALGIYTVSVKIPSLINVIISIFIQAWGLSSIREIESTKDNSFFESVFELYSFIVFGASVAFVSIIKVFMSVYIGKDFDSAWQYVPLLLCGAVFYSISAYFGSLYSALKKSVNNMITTLISAVVNVIVSLICIKFFGIWGAVLGTLMSYIVVAILRLFDIRRYIEFSIDWKRFMINCVLVLTQATLVSFNFYIYLTSFIVIVCFIINNLPQIKFLLNKSKNIIFKKEKF